MKRRQGKRNRKEIHEGKQVFLLKTNIKDKSLSRKEKQPSNIVEDAGADLTNM